VNAPLTGRGNRSKRQSNHDVPRLVDRRSKHALCARVPPITKKESIRMKKSPSLLQYELERAELRRRFQAGEISDRHYQEQKVDALRRALPKIKLEELAELDRQSFDLLTRQKQGRA